MKNFEDLKEIISLSDEEKKKLILDDKLEIQNRFIIYIISSFNVDSIIDFINSEKTFIERKRIKPFQFIKKMPYKKQIQLAENIDKMNLTEAEKRIIFASLRVEAKEEIDLEKVDKKYRPLLEIEISDEPQTYGRIIPNLDGDLTQYRDLDELLSINPLQMVKSDEDRQKLLRLCEICPNMEIKDNVTIALRGSTGAEYIKGEEWVEIVLQGIKPEWTDIQKLAHIDTAIGKKISYSPESGTEAEKTEDARALWKIITSGYGVCNGIAQIEQYLLKRVGIDSELVNSKRHTFVKVKNIAIPTENGIVQGDTLVDPTWNLASSRFRAMPQHFCKTYKELRKADIEENGKDRESHKNDELGQAETINMDEESLREVYKSIEIADKDGKFPICKLMEQATQIDETSNDMKSNIVRKFALLKEWCPEFASCQNSTISAIQDILFEANDHFHFEECIASRVYDKADNDRNAVLYIYIELENQEKLFFYADKETREFIQLSQQEFEAKFECYDRDLEKMANQKRPWENGEKIQKVTTEEGKVNEHI